MDLHNAIYSEKNKEKGKKKESINNNSFSNFINYYITNIHYNKNNNFYSTNNIIFNINKNIKLACPSLSVFDCNTRPKSLGYEFGCKAVS